MAKTKAKAPRKPKAPPPPKEVESGKKPDHQMRTVSVPVRLYPVTIDRKTKAIVTDKSGEPIPTHTRDELWAACRVAWGRSTALANAAMVELLAGDARPPIVGKMPGSPKVELYKLLISQKDNGRVADQWDGAARDAGSIIRAVERVYKAARFDVLRGARTLPTFRYPYPYRMHNQTWSVIRVPTEQEMLAGEWPVVSVVLPNIGRVNLILSRANGHWRALSLLRRIAAGDPEVHAGELSICRQRDGDRDGGHGTDRGPDRAKRPWTIMLRFSVGVVPRENPETQTMNLTTDPEALLVCWLAGRKDWVLNDDQVIRRIAAHRVTLQRLSQDRKAERRLRRQGGIQAKVEAVTLKHERYMDTYLHQTAAAVASYAVRNRVGCVFADLTPSGYLDSFPWFQLRERLRNRLSMEGIRFKGDEATNETQEEEI